MILDKIVEDKKIRLPQVKQQIAISEQRRMAEDVLKQQQVNRDAWKSRSFLEALKKPGISIIGEFKKASPSLGIIKDQIPLTDRMEEYNASVDAISCLTEEDHFHGSVDYLKQIRAMSDLPILRKDFMIEEYQFYEAKAIGADAVLLIAAILDDKQMHDFYQLAGELKLDVLVETHDEYEMERALLLDAKIIGVNNRNLKDFSIQLETTKRLAKMVPQDKIFVSESGINCDADVRFLKESRVDAFLIGRAFMESKNPKEVAKHWKTM